MTSSDGDWGCFERHVPGQDVWIGPSNSWKKTCVSGEIEKPRLRSIDARAALVSLKIYKVSSDGTGVESRDAILNLDKCFIDFEQELTAPTLRWQGNADALRHIEVIIGTMAPDDVCEVEIQEQDSSWVYHVTLHAAFMCETPWPSVKSPETQSDIEKRDAKHTVRVFIGNDRVMSHWKPQRFSLVTVDYQLICADTGQVIHDTRADGKPHVFTCGAGDVVPALDLAVRRSFTLGQRGVIIARPEAAFGPYDHSLKTQKLSYKRYIDHMSFMSGYETVFDTEAPLNDREDTGPVEWDEVSGAPILAKPLDVEIYDPDLRLMPSSIDMSKWLKEVEGRSVVFLDLEIQYVKQVPWECSFSPKARVRHADRWRVLGNRFWKIKDFVRSYQCYFQAEHILRSCETPGDLQGLVDSAKELDFKLKMNKIMCLGHLDEWSDASRDLLPLFSRCPDNEKVCYWMARMKLAQDDDIAAINLCKSIINVNPSNVAARALMKEALNLKKSGVFSKSFFNEDVLEKTKFVERDQPTLDWSAVEAAGLDSKILENWGLRPTRMVGESAEDEVNDQLFEDETPTSAETAVPSSEEVGNSP